MEYLENDIKKQKWYQNLVDDCQTIIVERVFRAKMEIIEGYHELGERVCTDDNFPKYAKGRGEAINNLARDIGTSKTTLYYATQFYEKYPVLSDALETFGEGKDISWHIICNKYLPGPKENIIEIPVPDGQYSVIVIDPPWPYGTEYNSKTRRVASPYPELSFEELSRIILPSANDCVLWLWTTHRFIWDAKELMEIWGFGYKLILVWDKEKLGIGSWLRCQSEFCLLGIKGNPRWNLTDERDLIREIKREHSRKPESFYRMVQGLNTGKKIDYFGRYKREGWDIYGNEMR